MILTCRRFSFQERLRLAKKRRAEQLRRWTQREREFGRDLGRQPPGLQGNAETDALVAHVALLSLDTFNYCAGRAANGHASRRITFEPSIMLLEAAARNDLDEVKRLLEVGVSPDSTNEDGLTALHQVSVLKNFTLIVKLKLCGVPEPVGTGRGI
jgi:protein phosphatase 1 regulatory subunit 16A